MFSLNVLHKILVFGLLSCCGYVDCAQFSSASGTTIRVDNGMISSNWVGTYTSQLQKNVFDKYLPPINNTELQALSLVNSTVLRYVELVGSYLCDVPLQIPSLTILKLNGTMHTSDTNLTNNITRFTAMVELNDVSFSGVVGGTYNATVTIPISEAENIRTNNSVLLGLQAISIVGGRFSTIRNVRGIANNSNSILGVNMGSGHEIAGCDVGGTSEAGTVGRCIWTLATSRALVHDNRLHHCSAHALDFDAYTKGSACFNNLCEDNGEEGIFVEETASNNVWVIVNNTCRRNGNGIGVYSNAVGPVASNFFINNVVTANRDVGITVGGMGHAPTKHSEANTFVGNVAKDNAMGAWNPAHGANIQDYWVSNVDQGEMNDSPEWTHIPIAGANVSIFEP